MMDLDLNALDKRGSTPLLWACYSLSETALAFLLSWNPDLDIQDVDGYTALHLAVKSVEKLGSTRPVRALLMKGANPSIRDNKGNLPIDYVKLFEGTEFVDDLKSMLADNSLSCCCFVDGPLRKI